MDTTINLHGKLRTRRRFFCLSFFWFCLEGMFLSARDWRDLRMIGVCASSQRERPLGFLLSRSVVFPFAKVLRHQSGPFLSLSSCRSVFRLLADLSSGGISCTFFLVFPFPSFLPRLYLIPLDASPRHGSAATWEFFQPLDWVFVVEWPIGRADNQGQGQPRCPGIKGWEERLLPVVAL